MDGSNGELDLKAGGVSRKNQAVTRTVVVLCTYNEIHNLPGVFDVLQHVAPEFDVLVVDDNSPDGTGKWALEQSRQLSRIHLISREKKLGLGSALRAAIQWTVDRDYEFMVNLDADLSHDPAKVPNFVSLAQLETADVVIGSRYIHDGATEGLSWTRRLLSRALNRYATALLKLPVRDCSGSYRCYRVSKLRQLQLNQLTCNGYGFLEEILVTLYRQDAKLVETPICYHNRHGGHSKLSFSDAVGALKVIHRLRR